MVKALIIVRHGKALEYNACSDIDRSLEETGINEAYKMAENLFKKKIIPELILSSTAARAIHTATIFSRTLEIDTSKIILNKNLYLATPETILEIISSVNNDINSIMIFGHNPGLSELANYFIQKQDINLPTVGIIGLKFKTDSWTELNKAFEYFFDYPKKHKSN